MHCSLLVVIREYELTTKYNGFETYDSFKFEIEVEQIIDKKLMPFLENDFVDNPNAKMDWYSIGVRESVMHYGDAFVLKNGATSSYAFLKDIDWDKTKQNFGGWFFTTSALIDDRWIELNYPPTPKLQIVKIYEGNDYRLAIEPVNEEEYNQWADECESMFDARIMSEIEDEDIIVYVDYHT
ncbi:MAG: hypothetical protein DRM99_03665 [Thermoplasmata archaeon]|nr:MAG: hypothetical protein DRM99_03665 [Thermoplasmata archaeon]